MRVLKTLCRDQIVSKTSEFYIPTSPIEISIFAVYGQNLKLKRISLSSSL